MRITESQLIQIIQNIKNDLVQEDFSPIFLDYGYYGSDTDGPSDHDTSTWTPLDDVEEPEENLSQAYVSRQRKSGKDKDTMSDTLMVTESQLRTIIREEMQRILSEKKNKAVKSRSYGKEEYKASAGSIAALEKSGGSKKTAVERGKFDWSENPYAAARSAEIVATGEAKPARKTHRKS